MTWFWYDKERRTWCWGNDNHHRPDGDAHWTYKEALEDYLNGVL